MATLFSPLVQWFLVSEIHLPGAAEATVVQSHLRYTQTNVLNFKISKEHQWIAFSIRTLKSNVP